MHAFLERLRHKCSLLLVYAGIGEFETPLYDLFIAVLESHLLSVHSSLIAVQQCYVQTLEHIQWCTDAGAVEKHHSLPLSS